MLAPGIRIEGGPVDCSLKLHSCVIVKPPNQTFPGLICENVRLGRTVQNPYKMHTKLRNRRKNSETILK